MALVAADPIATDRVEFVTVAEDSAADTNTLLDRPRLTLVDKTACVLRATDRSLVAADSEADVLTKSDTALETCAEVGEAPSRVSVDRVADRDTFVLVVLLRSSVTELRLVDSAV